jgi:galactokinase
VKLALFVPGRLCLLGEHSDWAGQWRARHPELAPGSCLVSGTDQGLRAEVERSGELWLESELADGRRAGPFALPMDGEALAAAARGGGFFAYAAGVAAEIRARFPVEGLRLRIRADLPVGKGLASSAAVCVLVARAFSRAFELGLSVRDEMELAFAGERRAGSECGRMDQVCAFGRRPSLMHFDGERLEVEPLAPGAPIHLLVVDLGRGKDTRRILADLNACFPDTPGERAAGVREALGEESRARVARAADAVRAGDARALGSEMREAQARFDEAIAPASPGELAAPRLHAVLAHPAVAELAWGGKGVGSQGDGCAQLVARDPEARATLAARLARELGVGTLTLDLRPPEDRVPHPLPGRLG